MERASAGKVSGREPGIRRRIVQLGVVQVRGVGVPWTTTADDEDFAVWEQSGCVIGASQSTRERTGGVPPIRTRYVSLSIRLTPREAVAACHQDASVLQQRRCVLVAVGQH